ncbi:hypothetical protein NA57DRAFT_63997 [Rhizodiscina lignyota]|uniref:Putative 5'-nucleotidase C-terminal domain-containing protein n=1 Tax=Rhizodiscina lignyota TaxID=1504668 RepID=A0A9P4MAA4_9PEZI|nr:hypothetical protein NA57DRAFT_63997 [Rhizodiscina lignyota]
MQPDARNATSGPRAQLEWGQLNVLHTTDTHGWLEGHIKETNYGADWGDWISFVSHMKDKAKSYGVDLLLVDTGDLHDGAGLSDATDPNGLISNPVFENVDYDLLTIGNHELYVSAIAYEHFNQFAKVYGDRYLTSNVEILNPNTSKYEIIGKQYRYFTTPQGLRIMSFGVIFDFTGNSNASRITPASEMVQQSWFADAVNFDKPIDLYLVLGHNPVRVNDSASTMGTVYQAIRKYKPDAPIQVFGGHSHIRDFQVYDNKATALESGRYCETLGWFSMSGFECYGTKNPSGVPNPNRHAVVVSPNATAYNLSLSNSSSPFTYSRRYLDWNRLTFAYHANGSQDNTFEIQQGTAVTAEIYSDRLELNLTNLYGCAPQTWCLFCKPYGNPGNILSLLEVALGDTVINSTRSSTPRLVYINSGSVRFDLVEGPFTYDDSFIVSPFDDHFVYIADVPYDAAKQVLPALNAGGADKRKRSLSYSDFNFSPLTMLDARDTCVDPPLLHANPLGPRSNLPSNRRIVRRTSTKSSGYVTYDDFGFDGDDTVHTAIPDYPQPEYIAGNGSFPTNGTAPDVVDVIFLDFIEDFVLEALNSAQSSNNYTDADVSLYLPESFTTNSYLPVYAKKFWQKNVPNCPVGCGVGC